MDGDRPRRQGPLPRAWQFALVSVATVAVFALVSIAGGSLGFAAGTAVVTALLVLGGLAAPQTRVTSRWAGIGVHVLVGAYVLGFAVLMTVLGAREGGLAEPWAVVQIGALWLVGSALWAGAVFVYRRADGPLRVTAWFGIGGTVLFVLDTLVDVVTALVRGDAGAGGDGVTVVVVFVFLVLLPLVVFAQDEHNTRPA